MTGKNAVRRSTADVRRNPYLADTRHYRKGTCRSSARRAAIRRRRRIRRAKVLLVCAVLLVGLACSLFAVTAKVIDALTGEGGTEPGANMRMIDAVIVEKEDLIQGLSAADYGKHPTWTEDFLTPNEYSRPGEALREIQSVFVHYTANPGTSAAQNRSYFEQQKDTHERSVSAHFIIGYEGEIIQCVPLDEIAYAVQTRNKDSVSIECCYLAEDGSFTQETYDSLILLLGWLVEVYDLDADEDILRHYDCGGKKCPIYYTEHEDAWLALKEDVKTL